MQRLIFGLSIVLLAACSNDSSNRNNTPPAPPSGGGSGAIVTANNDTAETTKNTPVQINILQNDSSTAGEVALLKSFDTSSVAGNRVSRDGQGTEDKSDDVLFFSPMAGYVGTDTFEYTATNADGDTDTATVTVTVIGDPVFAEDDIAFTGPDQAVTIDVLNNDTTDAPDGIVLLESFQQPSTGTVSRDDNNTANDTSDDRLIYTPATGEYGQFEFLYTAANNEGSTSTATVFVTVTEPEPVSACDINAIPAADRDAFKASQAAAGLGYCYETSFTSFDDTTIAIQVFVPSEEKMNAIATQAGATLGSGEKGFAPLIIHSHGFGGNKAEDFPDTSTELDELVARDAWKEGYWVISYTQRGFDTSSSPIGVMAPDLEGFDFVRLVDWAICHLRADAPLENATAAENEAVEIAAGGCEPTWGESLIMNDSQQRLANFDDNVSLGTVGYSYGGGFQFNAQSVDPRVDALLPMGTWHDLRFSLHPNDAPKTAWITIMTAFAAQGGNGQPLPQLLIDGNRQAHSPQNPHDAPHGKGNQVSVDVANQLGPNGAVAYCNGNQTYYGDKFGDADGEPHDMANPPAHANITRAVRADLFMIQGYGDTLFNFNEGYDNAKCFADAGVDVRLLQQTSGHPLPGIGPAHYAGSDAAMYLDEIVHCENSVGEQQRHNMREVGLTWFNDKLRNFGSIDTVGSTEDEKRRSFPYKACITQENTDKTLILDGSDPFFNADSSASANGHKFSREGVSYSSIDDVLVGGTEYTVPETTLQTGQGAAGQGADQDFRIQFAELYEVGAGESHTIAGIPTVDLSIERANPSADEIFFAGVGVQRATGETELLHFQAVPIRVFPAPTSLTLEDDGVTPKFPPEAPPTVVDYPKADPRNFPGFDKGSWYPIVWGGDGTSIPVQQPGDGSIDTNAKGRLLGVTARLNEGDKLGIMFFPEHPVYTSISSKGIGQVTITGKAYIPRQANSPSPSAQPDYVVSKP